MDMDDDAFNENFTFEQMGLAPPPMTEQPFASFMQSLRVNEAKDNVAPSSVPPSPKFVPPPPKYTTKPEPQTKAPETTTTGEQPKKEKKIIPTASQLRQVTYDLHLHSIMFPYVGPCDNRPVFMEMMGQIYQEYGCPDDPLAKMAIQQMVYFHELVAVFYRRAVEAVSVDAAKVYFSAAHRIAEDYRKTANQLRAILFDLAERAGSKTKSEGDNANKAVILEIPEKRARKKSG